MKNDPIELAIEFANKKFKEVEKDNHFLDVYKILKDEFHINDPELFTVAILHDIFEDTDTTYDELEKNFSKTIANLVQEVSHPKNYNDVQKLEYYEGIKHITPRAKMIKLADFASNLRAFIKIRKRHPEKPYHDQYIVLIRSFLESCSDSDAKQIVYELTKELEAYVTEKFVF